MQERRKRLAWVRDHWSRFARVAREKSRSATLERKHRGFGFSSHPIEGMKAHQKLRRNQGVELCLKLNHWDGWEAGGELTNGEETMLSECTEHNGKPRRLGNEQSKLRHSDGEKV
jgi:hypothetical protein